MTLQRTIALLSIPIWQAVLAAQEPPGGRVQIRSAQDPQGEARVRWTYTFACPADGGAPMLRLTLGRPNSFSLSAGQSMQVGENNQAEGTLVITVEPVPDLADAIRLTIELGPQEPLRMERQLTFTAGRDWRSAVALQEAPAEIELRRPIAVGNVAGSAIAAYVMPAQIVPNRPAPPPPPALVPPGPDGPPVVMFQRWVQAVHAGDMEGFSTAYAPLQWRAMTPEQRQQALDEYRQAFTTVLGEEYDPATFAATYQGSTIAGSISVRYGDKELPELKVRFREGRWVLVEE